METDREGETGSVTVGHKYFIEKKNLEDLNNERLELSAQCNKILENNNKLEQQLTENNKRYSSLESGYNEKLSHFKTICRRTEIELTVQHKQNDNLLGELKTVQEQHGDLLVLFEIMAQQKDNELIDLQVKYKQLQEQLIEMETTLEQQKLQFIMEKEMAQSEQRAEISVVLAKLEDFEMRYLELPKLNQENSIKTSTVTQCLETEIERQKLQIEELFGQNEKHHQTEIRALHEANHQLKVNSALKDSAAQAELRKSENQLSQLWQQIEGLQQNHLNMLKICKRSIEHSDY
ncbi:GH23488 [Drosophila grimshawi]|uniref:GH23488 n=1 Tax=Drosophila grimshawi TaxID=7222 RepID=B4K3F9_DROGR|nr:GH23488 [Drosophila grimshawi]